MLARVAAALDRVLRVIDRFSWAIRKRGVLGAAERALCARRPVSDEEAYARWRAIHEPHRGPSAERMRGGAVPVFLHCGDGLAPDHLARTLASLRSQVGVDWTARLVGRATAPLLEVMAALAVAEPRLIPLAPDSRVDEELAGSSEVAVLASSGVVLAKNALGALVSAAQDDPLADLIYGDEDRIDSTGRRYAPWFKPEFSPTFLRANPYMGRLLAFRTRSAAPAGGVGEGEPHDLALRLSERAARVAHVPRVLHHVPDDLTTDPAASARAIVASLARGEEDAALESLGEARFRVRYRIAGSPLVSIIVPTRDRVDLLQVAVASVLELSGWRSVELIVVDNGSTDPATRRFLDGVTPPHRVLRRPGPFDWAALNNDAARQSTGEYLLFLNNDIEAFEPGWMVALLEHAQRPGVGPVGAKLLYPDGTVQHAGVALGMDGFAGHPFRGAPGDDAGPGGLLAVARECSAVTGACLMVRRSIFESLGGFDPQLKIAFNDVDFCLRATRLGFRTIWTPHARLIHHESASRSGVHPRSEYLLVRKRWQGAEEGDPYLSLLDVGQRAKKIRRRR